MNPATIVIVLALLGTVLLALRSMHKSKKSGKCSCGCEMCGSCGKNGAVKEHQSEQLKK